MNRLKQEHPPRLQFFVHPDIPRQSIAGTVDVKSDGWCGFRTTAHAIYGDENKFWKVKEDMLACYNRNLVKYKQHVTCMYILDEIRDTVSYGLDSIGDKNENSYSTCPMEYWCFTPGCTQLAADTHRVPVAVYPDNSGPVPPCFISRSKDLYKEINRHCQ